MFNHRKILPTNCFNSSRITALVEMLHTDNDAVSLVPTSLSFFTPSTTACGLCVAQLVEITAKCLVTKKVLESIKSLRFSMYSCTKDSRSGEESSYREKKCF